MTDDEVDELLKAVDTSSGEINYTGMPPKHVPKRIFSRYLDRHFVPELAALIASRPRPNHSRQLGASCRISNRKNFTVTVKFFAVN